MGVAVGILSILASLVCGGLAVGLMTVSSATAQKIRLYAPTALPVSNSGQPVTMFVALASVRRAQGMSPSHRMAVRSLMQHVLPMPPVQEQQFDALLQECGQAIFPRGVPATEAGLTDALTEHALMQSSTADGIPPAFFKTIGGRAQIYSDRAVFYPADGSGTVRTSAGPKLNATGHPILRTTDVDALLNLVNQACAGKINAAQTATLTQMLQSPDQQLVAVNGAPELPTVGISGASWQPGGYVRIAFAGGTLLLSPEGRVVLNGDPIPGVSVIACMGVMLAAPSSISMAIWLLLLSNRLLKQTLLTPRQHLRWSAIKIVLSVASGLAFGWMIGTFIASTPGGASSASGKGMAAGGMLLAVGCAFPVTIIALLKTRRSKLYFDGVM